MMKHSLGRSGKRTIVVAIILILLCALAWVIFRQELSAMMTIITNGSTDDVVALFRSWGIWAPVASIGLMVLQAFIAPIPSFLITGANGVLFGLWGGVALSWFGAMLGAAGTFGLARILGSDYVRRFEKRSDLMAKVDQISAKHGFSVILVGRLLPFVSFDFLSYAAGLSRMKMPGFLVATGIGMLPGTFAYVLLGKEIFALSTSPRGMLWTGGILLAVFLVYQIKKRIHKNKKTSHHLADDQAPEMHAPTAPDTVKQLPASRPILLIGGGHTHLELLRLARRDRWLMDRVLLIAKEPKNWYSGMASSWIEGIYSEEEISIDLKAQADAYGIPLVIGAVQSVDFQNRKLLLENGDSFSYELLSFDIGSLTMVPKEVTGWPSWYPVKPFSRLSAFLHQQKEGRMIVMGSGAAAMELATALGKRKSRARKLDNGTPTHQDSFIAASDKTPEGILLLTYPTGLMRGHPENVRRSVMRRMSGAERISIISDEIVSIDSEKIRTLHHECPYDAVLVATGPVAAPLFRDSGFVTDDKGYLLVRDTLQSLSSPFVFGAGDCIAIQTQPLGKTGVHAIRQAPVLLANLKAAMQERPLLPYRPTKRHLAIFSTGARTAVLQYGSFIISGRIAWWIKHWIDWSYMQKHRHKRGQTNQT